MHFLKRKLFYVNSSFVEVDCWWLVSIDSDNGLCRLGDLLLPEPISTKIYDAIWICTSSSIVWYVVNPLHAAEYKTERKIPRRDESENNYNGLTQVIKQKSYLSFICIPTCHQYLWYVYMFSICCSDSPYLLCRMTMYIRSCIFILWNWGHHSAFCVICVMIDAEERTGQIYDNFAGTENDLNRVLSTFVDSEHEISNFCHSRYVDLSEVQSIFQNNPNEFLILTLNIQSVNAKFNNSFPVIDNLALQGLYFGAMCLQETWTSTDSDLTLLQLPGYQLIHQGSKCTKHGGLMIYLNESYSYKIRNLFTNSNIWEGLFIDINGGILCRAFTIGNIYRPPYDNNNNANIQQFISELSPMIDIIQRENTYAAIVGDFNINLLQISEREKFGDFLDLMCANNFFHKISFPTRFAGHSCSLIDQIFFKTPHKKHVSISSSIIFSNLSDHLPCTVNLCISEHTTKEQKYVRTRVINDAAINNFRSELTEIDMSSLLNANLATDPNTDYEKFEKIITKTYDKHFQRNVLSSININTNGQIG